jgi:hypothetical protein
MTKTDYNVSLIISFPINIIRKVILLGEANEYYRLYMVGDSKNVVRVDLTKGVKDNFYVVNKSRIYSGHLVQELLPQSALNLLMNDRYLNGKYPPKMELMDVLKYLFELSDFHSVKSNIDKKSFSSWLIKQIGRDDFIGDLASHLKRSYYFCGIESTDQISEWVREISSFSRWQVNSLEEVDKDGLVNPLLVLKLAQMEFDIYTKKIILNKFAIKDSAGYVYFIRRKDQNSLIKIGRAKNIFKRISQLQTSSSCDLDLIGYIETDNCVSLETKIHKEYREKRVKREWFSISEEDAKSLINRYDGIFD